jgi:hypothetical protein
MKHVGGCVPAEVSVNIHDRGQRPEREDALERQVLRVIQNHPYGIRPVDVGNELGLDWRALLGVIRHLVEDGAVERIDQQWYPAGNASRCKQELQEVPIARPRKEAVRGVP